MQINFGVAGLPNTEEDDLSISTDNQDNDTEVPLEKEYILATQKGQIYEKAIE